MLTPQGEEVSGDLILKVRGRSPSFDGDLILKVRGRSPSLDGDLILRCEGEARASAATSS